MSGFENDRKWIIEKKNDVAIRSMDLKEKIDEFDQKKAEVEEGISRIPSDLPDELRQQIQEAVENARAELDSEANDLGVEADSIKETADETIDMADNMREEYSQKAERLRELSNVPMIGSFANEAAEKLENQANQVVDLRQETVKYRDDAAMQHNRLRDRR
jgi:uncharacterized coiled-coil DUF342 family protein